MNSIAQVARPSDAIANLLFDQSPDALLVYDLQLGCFVEANTAAASLFECSHGELMRCGPEAFHSEAGEPVGDAQGRVSKVAQRVLAGRAIHRELWIRTAKGHPRCCEMKLSRLGVVGRELIRASYVDVTDRLELQSALRAEEAHMAELAQHRHSILDNVLAAIITTNADGLIQSFNRAASQIFGYTPNEAIGQALSLLMPEPERAQHDGYLARYEATRQPRVIGVGRETYGQHKNGRVFPIHLSVSVIERLGRSNFIGLIRDISEQKEVESNIERLAYYDALTGMPNRRLLIDCIAQMQRQLSQQGGHAVLIFAGIDQFKVVNDTLGHAAGDALLRSAGKRFTECVGTCGLVARLGGGEFALLIGSLDPDEPRAIDEATTWCKTLLKQSRHQHGLFGREYRTSVSLGVLLFRDGREMPEALLAHADLAMYQAKSESRDTFRFFDAEMARVAALQATLLNDLRLALPRQELVLMFQPQVDSHGCLLGAEALVRWLHPTRGMVSPADFIPLAEQSGFILEIGNWVLRQACEVLADWRRDPQTSMLSIAVNVSATEFRDPDYVSVVSRTLVDTGVDPSRLKLELTESVLAVDLADLKKKLWTFKQMGVGLSLDDFGTGYSSMAYLRELPLDQLKIDRSFIVEIEHSARDEAILRGIVDLCRVLELSVIAEGVETEGQRAKLADCGCRSFQGFLTGRPMSSRDFSNLVAANQRPGIADHRTRVAVVVGQ
jgi:diguanylate cyclase (GGDEF)-like protein/PAS domain S-box-containing protein